MISGKSVTFTLLFFIQFLNPNIAFSMTSDRSGRPCLRLINALDQIETRSTAKGPYRAILTRNLEGMNRGVWFEYDFTEREPEAIQKIETFEPTPGNLRALLTEYFAHVLQLQNLDDDDTASREHLANLLFFSVVTQAIFDTYLDGADLRAIRESEYISDGVARTRLGGYLPLNALSFLVNRTDNLVHVFTAFGADQIAKNEYLEVAYAGTESTIQVLAQTFGWPSLYGDVLKKVRTGPKSF